MYRCHEDLSTSFRFYPDRPLQSRRLRRTGVLPATNQLRGTNGLVLDSVCTIP